MPRNFEDAIAAAQTIGKSYFAIKTWLPGNLPRERVETDTAAMETLLPEIIGAFAAAGRLLVVKRREREEEATRHRIAEQRRYEEQQRRQLERNRWHRFGKLAKQWQQTQLGRDFLDALKSREFDPQPTIGGKNTTEWIVWPETLLHTTDPLDFAANGIFSEVAEIDA